MAIEDYRGRDGYRRMVQELRASVAREFPERADDIYIVDMTADRGAEMAAAARQLGMSVAELMARGRQSSSPFAAEFPNIQNGNAYPITRPDGTTAWVVFSWPPEAMAEQGVDQLTPNHILEMSKVILHEVGHALSVGDSHHQPSPTIDDTRAEDIREESQAEVFALAALTDNGVPPSESDELCAMYDARKYDPINPNTGGLDSYDPSEEYRHLRDTYLTSRPQRPFTSYNLTGLRETFDATQAAFAETPESRQQGLEYIACQRALLLTVAQLRRTGLTEDQIAQWVIDRQNYIYDGAQVESGRAYLANPTGNYVPAQPATGSYPQSVGRAWLAALNNPQDNASKILADWMVLGMREMVEEGLYPEYGFTYEDLHLPMPITDARWRPVAEMLARGERPERVREAMRAVDVTERGMGVIESLRRDAQRNGLRDAQGDGVIDNGDIRAWLQENGIPPEMAQRFDYSDGVNHGELSMLYRASNNAWDRDQER